MEIIKLQSLLNSYENDDVEFKASIRATQAQEAKNHVARSITAFYNTRGGVIIFGIENKTNNILGIDNPQQLEESVMNMIQQKVVDLDIPPSITFINHEGKNLVIVQCPKGERKPYYWVFKTIYKSREFKF